MTYAAAQPMTYAQPQAMTYAAPEMTYAAAQPMTYAQPQAMTYAAPQATYVQPAMSYPYQAAAPSYDNYDFAPQYVAAQQPMYTLPTASSMIAYPPPQQFNFVA